ncbi:MAG TPA: hypothetical protein VIU15_39755 [Streptomyces sp.]
MSDSILVRITLDRFDLASTVKQTQVRVEIPEMARVGWLLPEEMYGALVLLPWEEALREVFAFTDGRIVPEWDAQLVAARQRVREWLAVDEHRAAMHEAWFAAEARRHPVSRSLLADVERLRVELDVSEQRSERRRIAWRMARQHAIAVGGAADRYAARARSAQDALQHVLFTVIARQLALKASVDERSVLEARVAELKAERADRRDELALALGRDSGSEWGDLIEFAAGAVSVETKLRARVAELEGGLPAMQEALCRALDRVSDLEAERHSTNEVFVPQTERSRWVAIADALNAAQDAGMPVGIDLDGTLTDHRAWSVVWDRDAGRWTVAGYDDGEPDGITRRIVPTQALQSEPEAPALTVYRASRDSIAMGLYSTAAEARKHCETVVRRAYTGSDSKVSLWWREDEDAVGWPEGGEAQLYERVTPNNFGGRSYTGRTGYVVTALEVAAEYDAEADE